MNEMWRTALRDRRAGDVSSADVGSLLRLSGWVHRRRDLGGLVFIDLRDRAGIVQVSLGPDWTEATSLEVAHELGQEDVVAVVGEVTLRPEPNPDLATGALELRARELRRVSRSRTPAIPVYRAPDEAPPSEELRLRHRVLDLRSPEMQEALDLRHRLILAARNHLDSLGFVEVETPILTKPTPEGARDYLVPSRVHPGEFYALPQSPQIYKQVLMVAGFDRYYQIARCFRDEDLRADRQPEFTQIDVEASFIDVDDILRWMEGLIARLAGIADIEAHVPFARLTWRQAMDRFGSDRPDLRWSLEIQDWTEVLRRIDFAVVRSALEADGRIRGLLVENGGSLSRRRIEAVEAAAKATGAPGLLWMKRVDGSVSGSLARFVGEAELNGLGLPEGGLALIAVGADSVTSPALDAARAAVIEALDMPPSTAHAWLWVTDFPLFEGERGQVAPGHHPFVQPHPEDLDRLDLDPTAARGLAYDLVYNGTELGSGSLRIHEAQLQRRVLRILGLTDEQIGRKFGFLLEALENGAPPHGGIALGVDRIVQRFCNAASLRDVIAFPKTTAARALYEGAPAPLDDDGLEELGLRLRPL